MSVQWKCRRRLGTRVRRPSTTDSVRITRWSPTEARPGSTANGSTEALALQGTPCRGNAAVVAASKASSCRLCSKGPRSATLL